jgi:NAD(P)H-dependent FMN reductase
VSGGLRAVEQLRLVFAKLHATTVRDTVTFQNAWRLFGPGGELLDPTGATVATETTLDERAWWATALRTGTARRAGRRGLGGVTGGPQALRGARR